MTRQTRMSSWVLGAVAAIAAQCLTQAALADAAPETSRPIVLKAAHLFDSVSGKLAEQRRGGGVGRQDHGGGQRCQDSRQCRGHRPRRCHPVARLHRCPRASGAARPGRTGISDFFDGIMRFPAEQALYGAHYAKAHARGRHHHGARLGVRATTLRSDCAMPSTRA